MDYDPLLSKLIAWGNSREETIARLTRALEEYKIIGIKTNVSLFRRILTEHAFLRSEIHTKWLDELLSLANRAPRAQEQGAEDVAAIAAAFWQMNEMGKQKITGAGAPSDESRWKREGRREQVDRTP
jgi:acetyl-CoA carboxylase biotin carboxylase subunit